MDREGELVGMFFHIGRDLAEEFLVKLRPSARAENTEYQRAMFFFFAKAYKSYQAVELFCDKGFIEEAYVLARGIYELRLQAIYMGNEPGSRSEMFFNHWVLSAFGTLQVLRRHHPDKTSELNQGEAEVRKGADAIDRGNLLHDSLAAERAITKKWWNGGIKGLLHHLNSDLDKKCQPAKRDYDFEKEYEIIYSQLSDYVHSGVRLLHKYSIEEFYQPVQRTRTATTLSWSVTDWLSQIIGLTGDAFELGFGATVLQAQMKARNLLGR